MLSLIITSLRFFYIPRHEEHTEPVWTQISLPHFSYLLTAEDGLFCRFSPPNDILTSYLYTQKRTFCCYWDIWHFFSDWFQTITLKECPHCPHLPDRTSSKRKMCQSQWYTYLVGRTCPDMEYLWSKRKACMCMDENDKEREKKAPLSVCETKSSRCHWSDQHPPPPTKPSFVTTPSLYSTSN